MNAGRLLRRLLVVVLVAAVAVACLRLGWWQWQRYRSTSGSVQNLGYTLQWPVFALFVIFMWWRFSRLEARRRQEAESPPAASAAAPADAAISAAAGQDAAIGAAARRDAAIGAAARREAAPRPAPSGERDEPDDELAAYNRYLAELHAKESDRAR